MENTGKSCAREEHDIVAEVQRCAGQLMGTFFHEVLPQDEQEVESPEDDPQLYFSAQCRWLADCGGQLESSLGVGGIPPAMAQSYRHDVQLYAGEAGLSQKDVDPLLMALDRLIEVQTT